MIANESDTEYMIFCDQVLKLEGSIRTPLSFSLSNFHIGDGFTGRMQEFKMYYLALGKESLTKVTSSKLL